jgi:hypothetical protein
MAKQRELKDAWDRPLSLESFLAMTILMFELLDTTGQGLVLEVRLADGTSFGASSLDELFDDVKNVRDDFVTEVLLRGGSDPVEAILRSTRVPGPPITWLQTLGRDDTYVFGIHAQAKKAIDEAFASEDEVKQKEEEAQREKQEAMDPSTGAGGIHIGAIHGGTVALTGSGASTASSGGPSPDPVGHWWNNIWLVTIVGGIVAAIFVAALIALLA